MRTSKKEKIYQKGLRILWREIHRLDLKSQEKGLDSQDRADLVRMLKPLEATIKEDPKQGKKQGKAPAELVREAQQVLQQYYAEESTLPDTIEPQGSTEGNE